MKAVWLIILLAAGAAIGSWWAPGLAIAAMFLAIVAFSLLGILHREETLRINRAAADAQNRHITAARAALDYRRKYHDAQNDANRAREMVKSADASADQILKLVAAKTRPTEAKRLARALLDTRSLYAPTAAQIFLARAKPEDGAK